VTSHPLDASRAKISDADHDLARLDEAVQRIFDPGPYAMVSEFDSQTRQHTVRAQREADLPLIEWGVLIGSIAHNLRSALNYVITELVRAHKVRQPGKQHEFPIFEDPGAYHERDSKGRPQRTGGLYKIDGIDPRAATEIERLQPYNVIATATTPVDVSYSALWALHELNRVDKHQDLIVPTPIIRTMNIWTIPGITIDEHIVPGPLEDDAMLYRWTMPAEWEEVPFKNLDIAVPRSTGGQWIFPPANTQVAVHAHFTFDVAFSQSGPTKGDLVLESMRGLRKRASETIEEFASFFS
jgi:hypothetical protein